MTGPPRSYTGRRDLIAEKLEPYFQISAMLPKNTRPTSETAEEFWDNSLWCSWGDRETGYTRTVTVSICQVADGEREAEGVRDMMRLECPAGLDFFFKQKTAYEMLRSLVGSEMCIRDRGNGGGGGEPGVAGSPGVGPAGRGGDGNLGQFGPEGAPGQPGQPGQPG